MNRRTLLPFLHLHPSHNLKCFGLFPRNLVANTYERHFFDFAFVQKQPKNHHACLATKLKIRAKIVSEGY